MKDSFEMKCNDSEYKSALQELNQIFGMLQNMLRPINNEPEVEFPMFTKIVDRINEHKKQFNK
jgi:hypothetical protein